MAFPANSNGLSTAIKPDVRQQQAKMYVNDGFASNS